MTSLTLSTIALVVLAVVGRRGFGVSLALGGATAAGAAVAISGTPVPTFYAVACGLAIALGLRVLVGDYGVRVALPPGVPVLLLFLLWCFIVTLLSPIFFPGTRVLTAKGPGELVPGVITMSNLAQVLYLFLGVCVVLYLARSDRVSPALIGLATGLTTLLSFWRYCHLEFGVVFPEGVFDNSPTLAFIETDVGGAERFRGILSEPSSLGASCLVTIGYACSRLKFAAFWERFLLVALIAMALFMGFTSTSATFVVAGVALAAIALLVSVLSFVGRRVTVSAALAVVVCGASAGAVWFLPRIAILVEGTVNTKLGTSSYLARSGADAAAYQNFLETFGVGVGLGASRASSFVPALLGTTGFIGTVLFVGAISSLIGRTWSIPECRPVIWALAALLLLKVIAGPDLSESTGILFVGLGVLSHRLIRDKFGGIANCPYGAGLNKKRGFAPDSRIDDAEFGIRV